MHRPILTTLLVNIANGSLNVIGTTFNNIRRILVLHVQDLHIDLYISQLLCLYRHQLQHRISPSSWQQVLVTAEYASAVMHVEPDQ